MNTIYVEQRDGGYWIADTRISLESVLYPFWDGLSPETIATECFPLLSLEQVYGAITYYLNQRPALDQYLHQMAEEFVAFQQETSDPVLARKLAHARP